MRTSRIVARCASCSAWRPSTISTSPGFACIWASIVALEASDTTASPACLSQARGARLADPAGGVGHDGQPGGEQDGCPTEQRMSLNRFVSDRLARD